MKAKPIFIAVAAIFSASAIAGGAQHSSSQGASQEPAQQQSQAQSGSQQNPEIVKQAQEKLSAAGHEVQPDGKMGPQTQAALKEFQQKEGLQASGRLDQETLAALEIGTPEGSASAGSSSERAAEPSEPSKPQ